MTTTTTAPAPQSKESTVENLSRRDRLVVRWWLLKGDVIHRVEKTQIWIARHVPSWLAKWVTVCAFANATTGKYGGRHPDEVRYRDVCEANGW